MIVVGGDLHVHPRAVISGRAVAIGGGVYESTMSRVGGGIAPYRDFTYDLTEIPGGYALRYRSLVDRPTSVVTWPGIYGLQVPAYDRSNGVSLSAGPRIAVPGTQWLLDPRVTYRSQLGTIDASVDASEPLDSRTTLRAGVGRGTFTNDAWIWPDVLNSAGVLAFGHDTRNYFRATRAQLSIGRAWETTTAKLEPYVGARWEKAASVRPDTGALGGPWSFRGRRDLDDMLRPNPRIDAGKIASFLVGGQLDWSSEGVVARANLDAEVGRTWLDAPGTDRDRTLAQVTFDGTITFPTFGAQTLRFDAHAVGSPGWRAPRQRWAYVGGAGSVPTIDLLERGGDQLIYLDGRYNIPIERVILPLVGSPVFTLREVLAGADVGRWPGIAQAMGVRLSVSVVYVELMVDPVSRRRNLGAGISLAR